MRISDWSSDVCSSELADAGPGIIHGGGNGRTKEQRRRCDAGADDRQDEGILGRGRAALVLPKTLQKITHCFSPFLCWFPDPPPDASWRARAGFTWRGDGLPPATGYLPRAN